MNDQKIYELMFRTPNIRAAQISDALDADLGEVSRALRPLVEIGDVVQHKGIGPNGQPALMYNLSDDFKKSRQHADLVAAAAAAAKPTQAPAAPAAAEERSAELLQVMVPSMATATLAPTPAPTESPTAAPALAKQPPDAQQVDERRISPMKRTERALAFLRQCGSDGARTEELCDAMGLRHDQSPSNFLRTARSRGQVTVKDHRWRYVEQPEVNPAPPVRPMAPTDGPFRCGIWLGDVIELQRGGATIDTLVRAEAEVLRDFLNRVLPARREP